MERFHLNLERFQDGFATYSVNARELSARELSITIPENFFTSRVIPKVITVDIASESS